MKVKGDSLQVIADALREEPMPEDELRFMCRETNCRYNNRPYCNIPDGRPIVIGAPNGTCQQFEEKKEESNV